MPSPPSSSSTTSPLPTRSRLPVRGFFGGWVRTVTRWLIVTIVLVVAGLGAPRGAGDTPAARPPRRGSLEETAPGRVAFDLIAEHFGPGYNGPLLVTGSVIESTDPVGLMNDLGAEIATLTGVASVP